MISLWWPISPIKKIVCFTHGKPQELSRIRLGMYAGWTSGHHDTRVFQSLNNRDRHGSTPNKLQIEQIKSPQNHDLHKMATCLGFKQIQMPWRKKKTLCLRTLRRISIETADFLFSSWKFDWEATLWPWKIRLKIPMYPYVMMFLWDVFV